MQTTHDTLASIILDKKNKASKEQKPHKALGWWLSEELNSIDEDNQLFECEATFYSYSRITLQRSLHGVQASLDVKIGDIDGEPFYFADVRLIGQYYRPMLPTSGTLVSAEDKAKLLSYVADFILSVQSGEIEKNPRFAEFLDQEYKTPYSV